MNGSIRKNHVDYEVLIENTKTTVGSHLNAECSQKSKGDWNLNFNLYANKHKIDVTSTREIDDAAQKSTVKNEIKSTFGTQINVNSKFDNEINRQKADVSVDGNIVAARGQKPLKFDFKFNVTPKSGDTSGKFVADTTEFVSFKGHLDRNAGDASQPITGTLDVAVHDFVNVQGKYNSLKGDGKSDVVFTFPRFDRKVKIDTKYNYAPNKFDLVNDFYYDFEKDNSRHISCSTKNKYSSQSFDSANEVDINGEKFQFNIDLAKTGEWTHGKQNGKFLLRLPTQREITGTLDRTIDLTSPKATAHANLKITDTLQASAGRKSRSFEFDGTLKDGNREQRFFDLLHKTTLTDFDGKAIVLDTHFKHLPKGEFRTAIATFGVSGSIPNAVSFSIGADEYCEVHAVYHANAKYGDSAIINFNGDYAVGEADKKPATFKLNGKISVPQSKLKDLSFDSRSTLKYPDPKNPKGQYEYDTKFNCKVNDKESGFEASGKGTKNNGEASLTVKLADVEPFSVDLGYNYDHQPEQTSYHTNGNVQVRYGNGKSIKVSGDAKFVEGKEASLYTAITTPYEKAKSLEFTFKWLKKAENTYASEIELAVDDKKYKYTEVVVLSRVNPSIQMDIYYPPNGHSQLAASLTRVSDRKYKSSLRLDNINGFNLVGDAELSYQSIENFALVFDLDSEALKANKLHVDVHTKQNGNNKGIEFSASEQNKNIISGTADYQVKEEKGKTTIDGKGTVNWYDKSSAVTFQLMKNTFDQAHNNETGVLVSFYI